MAKTKNIHTATTRDGVTHKRTSEGRVYTHCVAVRQSYAHALAEANRVDAKSDARNFAWYAESAAQTVGVEYQPKTWAERGSTLRTTPTAQTIARAQAILAGCATVAEWSEAQRAQRVANVEANKAAGQFDRWSVLGWCGREDLARKLLNGDAAKPYYAEAEILPATVVTK